MQDDLRAWREYDAWNDSLRDVMFPPQLQPAPVYLDLEDEKLDELAARTGVERLGIIQALADAVAATSELNTNHAFRVHGRRLTEWWDEGQLDPPPILPLLAVFSLAAEQMTAGSGMTANNYYGRLAALLRGDTERVSASYRQLAEPLWGGLNAWLVRSAGVRGIPTAYSLGMRYVGLAVSQALVREADRLRLRTFFSDFDLPARAVIPPGELEPLLDAWMAQAPSPAGANLVSLWSKPSLQGRVAEIAGSELAEWDGSIGAGNEAGSTARIDLGLEIGTFPQISVRLFPIIRGVATSTARAVQIETLDGPVHSNLELADGGDYLFTDRSLFTASDLLEGVLGLLDPDLGHLLHQPRRLVVFKRNELTGRWSEARQVLLGDDVVALVLGSYVKEVVDFLAQVARPGWRTAEGVAGLPEGWTVVRDIEVFSRPVNAQSSMSDLSSLVALTSSQLKFAGGISLPGRIRNRWHSSRPPEIRALSDTAAGFNLSLIDLGPPGRRTEEAFELDRWSDRGTGSIVVDLADYELADGEYVVEMTDGQTGELLTRREFSLRSADTPDLVQRASEPPITHQLWDPLAVAYADHATERDVVLPKRTAMADHSASDATVGLPWWRQVGPAVSSTHVQLARPEPGSCFYTGRHHEVIERVELDSRGRPITKTTAGKCKFCGRERRYSSEYWRNRRAFERRATPPVIPIRDLPPITGEAESDRWTLALDCLQFAGAGPHSAFERLARQFDPAATSVVEMRRTLVSLGHIEIQNSSTTLAPQYWMSRGPSILDLGSKRVLIGAWNTSLRSTFRSALERAGRRLDHTVRTDGPAQWSTDATELELRALDLSEEIEYLGRAGVELANSLSALSSVVDALPRVPWIQRTAMSWFDPSKAAWVEVPNANGVGAYRTNGFARKYFLITDKDIYLEQAAIGDPFLVKHAASIMLAQRPLIGYAAADRELITPLGAGLPGQYERAVLLDTQEPPIRRRGFLIYKEVSPSKAAQIKFLLEN